MKRIEWKLLCGLVLLALFATSTYAASPREQLKQMVEQLQQNPSDDALREKIIKLAQTIKPATAVPDEALRHEGRGKFAFKNAKSPDDYLDAAKEYEQAANLAPWVAGYYSDLCTIHEKAGNYAVAKRNCEIYLTAITSQAELAETKERIAGLEYAIEKMAKQKNQGEEFLRKLDGARFVRREHVNYQGGGWEDGMHIYEIRGNRAVYGFMTTAKSEPDPNSPIGVLRWFKTSYLITGREFVIPITDTPINGERFFDEMHILSISEDGNKITEHHTFRGQLREEIYLREK